METFKNVLTHQHGTGRPDCKMNEQWREIIGRLQGLPFARDVVRSGLFFRQIWIVRVHPQWCEYPLELTDVRIACACETHWEEDKEQFFRQEEAIKRDRKKIVFSQINYLFKLKAMQVTMSTCAKTIMSSGSSAVARIPHCPLGKNVKLCVLNNPWSDSRLERTVNKRVRMCFCFHGP